MVENAVVERVSSVKSCLPAKAVVKTSPDFRPELADWLLIRGPLDKSVLYSEERGEQNTQGSSPVSHFPPSTWMDAALGCFRMV